MQTGNGCKAENSIGKQSCPILEGEYSSVAERVESLHKAMRLLAGLNHIFRISSLGQGVQSIESIR